MANTALTGIVAGAASQAEQEAGSSSTVYTSPGRQHLHPSAAKAWVNFNGTGTVAIRASYNVTSVTDNGTGEYTINFTNAMSSTDYSVVASQSYSGTNVNRSAGAITFATGSVKILVETSAGTRADSTIVCVNVFGDM
jgi:hypothetical protein